MTPLVTSEICILLEDNSKCFPLSLFSTILVSGKKWTKWPTHYFSFE